MYVFVNNISMCENMYIIVYTFVYSLYVVYLLIDNRMELSCICISMNDCVE